MSTDVELLERFVAQGAEPAFAELVQRHIAMVYGAALRHVGGDVHLAQDVAQAVFVSLARKAWSLRGREALAGWLYLSAHHAAAQVVRAERRRKNREEAHAMQEQLTGGENVAEWERVRPVLDTAMRELGETDREAVLLRFFEQRPFAAVGAALNVSEDAARMRVERALEKLRGLLARHGITSTSAALGAVLTSHASVVAPAALTAEVVSAAALGGAALGTAGATVFMKTLTIAVSAVAIATTGGLVYQTRQVQRAETQAAVAAKERDALTARLNAAQQSAEEAERKVAAINPPVAAKKTNAQPVVATPAAPAPGVMSISAVAADGTMKGTRHFEDTPEGRRAMIRNAVAETFAAFFRKMGWDERQQELFKDLWSVRKDRERVLIEQAKNSGKPLDRAVAQDAMRQAAREFDDQMREAFGDAEVEARRDYERKGAFRHVAEETAKRVFYSDAPLTHQQADQLGEIMAQSARRPDGKFDIAAMDRDAVFSQAQALLTPAQLAAFRDVEAELRRQRELEQRAWEQRSGSATPPAK